MIFVSVSSATPPAPPANLVAQAVSVSQINLGWTDQSTDEKGFKIFQSLDAVNFTLIAKTKANVTAYSISGATAGVTYYFRLCAFSSGGKSTYSNIASATTQQIVVSAPRAFPGAVGFGSDTPAGRGGAILTVTNLNDAGAGSLRAALEAVGPRIVVFEVSGTIQLLSQLDVRNPFLTIAGQTAPSPGITLNASEFNISTHDVLLQHIRIRIGDQLPPGIDPESLDGLSADGSYTGGEGSYNVVMDHVSISWAIDENAGGWGENIHDITFSNCIISEALYLSLHPKGAHSMGMLIAPNARNVAIIRNVFAHNADRNPLISVGASVVIANNVFYNWMGGRATGIGNSVTAYPPLFPTLATVVQNAYIGGINTTKSTNAISSTTYLNTGSQIYYSGNYLENVPNEFRNLASFNPVVSTPPITLPGFTAIPANNVVDELLLHAGARPLDRDDVDLRIANDIRFRSGQVIDSPSQVGGLPLLVENTRALVLPADPSGDVDGDGYTNIEEDVLIPMAQSLEP